MSSTPENTPTPRADEAVTFTAVNEAIAAADAPIDFNGQRLVNIGAPVDATDGDTKGARDTAIATATANIPSADEKAALVGTAGTPGSGNKYVTNDDSRNTNARAPTTHGSDHISTGTDAIPVAVPSGASGLLSGAWAALLNAATSAATTLTLALRDASGRFKAADPSANDDVDTLGARNVAIASAITPFGTLVASLGAPASTVGATTTTLLTLSSLLTYTAGTSKRFIIIASSYVSPDDGTTSGYIHALIARTRRQAGGTYTVDSTTYLINSEQSAGTDLTLTGGASSLTVSFVGVAATTIVTTSCRVYEL
jgi:hypothetical protein